MKSILFTAAILLGPLGASLSAAENGDLRLAKIFTDNMVLQQQKPIAVWGWTKPGAAVSVTITQQHQVGKQGMTAYQQQTKARVNAVPENGEYVVKIQYVEQNPPRLPTQTLQAKANQEGRWQVRFPAAQASFQPTWIIASSDDVVVAVQNVLIGEIWVC
ncbi:MAG: hypothetical protein GY888_00220, partial [Planctomycetaceae bacterium]|nr:hypothetical protein [Planctomycetaceae bacterium]